MIEGYQEIADLFRDLLLRNFNGRLVSLALYGSVARGTSRKDSDVDFLIIMRDIPRSYGDRISLLLPLIYQLEKSEPYLEMRKRDYDPYVQFVVFREDECIKTRPLFLDLVDDAVILYDEGFLKNKLEEIKKG